MGTGSLSRRGHAPRRTTLPGARGRQLEPIPRDGLSVVRIMKLGAWRSPISTPPSSSLAPIGPRWSSKDRNKRILRSRRTAVLDLAQASVPRPRARRRAPWRRDRPRPALGVRAPRRGAARDRDRADDALRLRGRSSRFGRGAAWHERSPAHSTIHTPTGFAASRATRSSVSYSPAARRSARRPPSAMRGTRASRRTR